jgi:Predicted membrane protein
MTFDPSEMTADSAEASAPELMDISDLAPTEHEATIGDLPPINTTAEFSISELPTTPGTPTASPTSPATAAELASLFGDREMQSVPAAGDGRTFEEEEYDPTVGRMLDLSSRTSSDALLPDLMMTESGAELLREQGHIEQAIYVYRHLAAKNPEDTSYAERIAALERGAHSSIPLIASISEEVISAAKNRSSSTKSIRAFFSSFASRRPAGGEGGHTSEAPAPSEPAAPAGPVAPVAEAPVASPAPAPVVESAAPPEAAPTVAPEPPATVSDDDRSALETLFSGKPRVAETDERAAAALASAFSEEFTPEPAGPAGQPTRAASDALSLDAVFQSSRTRSEGDARANQPNVSFDEFFANRENGNGSAESKSDAAVQTASLGEDSQSDLELFHEWLDGLKK